MGKVCSEHVMQRRYIAENVGVDASIACQRRQKVPGFKLKLRWHAIRY